MKVVIVKQDDLIHDNESGDEDDRFHRAYGVYDPAGPIIWLDTASGPERMKATLVHESLHALINAAHMAMDPADEEEMVGRLAPIILDFIRVNRGAVAYLQEN